MFGNVVRAHDMSRNQQVVAVKIARNNEIMWVGGFWGFGFGRTQTMGGVCTGCAAGRSR